MNITILMENRSLFSQKRIQYLKQLTYLGIFLKKNLITEKQYEKSSMQILKKYGGNIK